MAPLYTPANCQAAYELRWSLSLFATTALPDPGNWLADLQDVVERDGVRVLEHHFREPTTHQFLLSTKPFVAPPQIVKSVKGRLQHRLRHGHPDVFRRNFDLSSVGESRRTTIEAYVANQLGYHRMADERIQAMLATFQLAFPQSDLSQPQFSSHGRYFYNLHLVIVNDRRYCDVNEQRLQRTSEMVVGVARQKGHLLSRAAILPDHLHLTLGGNIHQSPEKIALGFLNNLAFAHGMRAVFQQGYFIGTFGEYDLGAIRQAL